MTSRLLGIFPAVAILSAANCTAQSPASPPATNGATASASPTPTASLIDELKSKAEAGDVDAEQKLGMAYYNGQIVAKDDAQAFAWVLKAAQQGNPTAGFNVAFMYYNGVGTKKDAAAGFQWYLTFAEKGVARAQYLVASAYASGNGTIKDPGQAFAWFQKAAQQGDAPAENDLGKCYLEGFGVAKDEKLSLDWYTKAANQGWGLAQLALGKAYFNGIGTTKDEVQGVAWYEKAAIQGNTEARTLLGVACLKGTGTPVDSKKGFTYLMNSSQTDADATYWVAWCYSTGTFVARDPVQAYAWGLRASSMTTRDDATKFLAALKPTLTKEQIDQAEKSTPDLTLLLNGFIQPTDTSVAFAQGNSSRITFTEAIGDILIPVVTQDHARAFLMIDTGANMSCLSQAYATKVGLTGNSYIPVGGIGETLELGTVTDQTNFAIHGMVFKNARWVIEPNFNFDADEGQPIVGILGMDLMKNLVVRLNFNDHTIEFIKPDSFTPQESDGSAILLAFGDNGQNGPLVQGTVIENGIEATGSFLIDAGNNGYIDLTKDFQDENPALKLRKIVSGAASGIGGVMYTSTGTCSTFVLGNIGLPNPQIDMEQSNQGIEGGLESGTIGTKILRHFNVVFDFPHKKIYLQKNAHFFDPYSYATAGMHVVTSGPDYATLTVHEMLPESAAVRAGFQIGDVITGVHELGKDHPLSLENVYPLLHTPGTYHFVVRRNDQTIPLVLQINDPLAGGAAASNSGGAK